MWNDLLTTLNTYGAAIQTIVLLVTLAPLFVTLIYFARQTRQLGRQLELANITSRGVPYRGLDELMLRDAAARDLANIPIETPLAHLFFGIFLDKFRLHRAGFMHDADWQAAKRSMVTHLSKSTIFRDVWNQEKHEYSMQFQEFMDREIWPLVSSPSPEQ
jgi:hypothetical protein